MVGRTGPAARVLPLRGRRRGKEKVRGDTIAVFAVHAPHYQPPHITHRMDFDVGAPGQLFGRFAARVWRCHCRTKAHAAVRELGLAPAFSASVVRYFQHISAASAKLLTLYFTLMHFSEAPRGIIFSAEQDALDSEPKPSRHSLRLRFFRKSLSTRGM